MDRRWAFPPPDADDEFLAVLNALGVTGNSPLSAVDSQMAAALTEGEQRGRAMIDNLAGGSADTAAWSTAKHLFDYNLDRLGLGTIDTAQWRIADRKTAYVTRAVIARAGLWGNNGYEAHYDFAWADSDGNPLNGASSYEVTFSPPPPAKAFWSLTMYDTPSSTSSPIPSTATRSGTAPPDFSTPTTAPSPSTSNTRPPRQTRPPTGYRPPAGAFRPVLRTCQPEDSILDDTYPLPEIRRVR